MSEVAERETQLAALLINIYELAPPVTVIRVYTGLNEVYRVRTSAGDRCPQALPRRLANARAGA